MGKQKKGQRKKNKGRKKKNKGKKGKKTFNRQFSNCSASECLNNMVKALKIEKDTVRNFLAQEKRVQSKINLMVNKGSKSGERDDNVRFLAARIGNKTLVTKQGALCAGTFNSTVSVNASIVAGNLFQCNNTIRE